jgi:tetratricopeptide (TPR) repeat protein
LRLLGDHDAALADLDRLQAEFTREESLFIHRRLAEGLLEQVWAWREMGEPKMAAPALERLTTEFFSESDPEVANAVTRGLGARGLDCYLRGEFEEAAALYDMVIERGSDTTDEQVWSAVVAAAEGKALGFSRRGDADGALRYLDLWTTETLRRFPASPSHFARLVQQRLGVLASARRLEEVVTVAHDIIGKFRDSDDPALRQTVARALLERAGAFGALGRPEEASGALEAIHDYPEEALAVLDWQIDNADIATAPWLGPWLAQTLLLRASLLSELDRDQESAETLESLISKFDGSDDPAVRLIVAGAREMRADLDADE